MKVDIARLRTQGYLTWPSLLAWVLFIVIVFQAWLLHLAADVFGITASIIRLVYVFTGFVGAALVFVSSFMLRGRRRLSAIVMAIALSITASVNVFQFIAYIIHIPRVNSVTEFSFLTAYLLGIIAVGAYFEWSLTWLGSLMGVVLDSVIAGYTVFIILSGWLPRTDIYGIWTPHLNGYITIDVAIFFALLVVVVRYGRRGGPGLVLGILAMVCLLMGDVAFTYSFYFSHTRTGLLAAPLYSLNGVLIGLAYYRSVYHPPQARDHLKEQQPSLDWFIWTWIPRQLIFAAFVKSALDHSASIDQVVLLVILGLIHESVAMIDYRRTNKHMYLIYAREQQAREVIQQQRELAEETNRKLRAFMTQAEDLAVEHERVRVAREIHDGLGHHLNNAKLHLGVASRYSDADHTLSLDSLNTAKSEIGTALRELRRAIDALVSNDFAGPLEALLQDPVRDCRLAGINASLQVAGTSRPLPQQVKHALYRIGQEAFNNIRQHSRAKQAILKINYQEHCIRMVIEDDGVGIPSTTEHRRGHGLENLQERAALVGGTSAIEPRPGQGVRVVVEVPI